MSTIGTLPLPHLALLLAALIASLPSASRAAFTLTAPAGALPPGSAWELYRHDLDSGDRRVAEMEADDDGSLSEELPLPSAVYRLKGPRQTELWLAPEEGAELRLNKQGADEAPAYELSGSPATVALQRYESFRRSSLERLVYPARKAAREAQAQQSPASEVAELADREVAAYADHLRELNDFVIDEIGPSPALYASALRWHGDHRLEELAEVVESFRRSGGPAVIVESLQRRIEDLRRLSIGSQAPDLEGVSPEGDSLRLSDYRGKVVLVDFWASWCPPCRIENRRYGALRERYPEEFAIFGVSLDQSRSPWLQAIRRDGIDWPQISDLKGLKSPLAERYRVSALPASFLLDREGKIVGKNLRGSALEAALAELLGGPAQP